MDYQLLGLLKTAGYRNTTARQTVFSQLKISPPLTIQELIDNTSQQLDRASCYRALQLFRQLGIIHDIVIAGQRKVELADQLSPHHHHATCSHCGLTQPISDPNFEAQIEKLALANGFIHQSHAFEITGLCTSCRRKEVRSRN